MRELLQFWRIRCSHPDLLPWTLNREMQPQTCQGRSGAHNTYYYVCMYYIVFFISDFWGYQDNNSRNGCQKTLNACSCFHPDLLPWTERLLPNATTDMPGKKCTQCILSLNIVLWRFMKYTFLRFLWSPKIPLLFLMFSIRITLWCTTFDNRRLHLEKVLAKT